MQISSVNKTALRTNVIPAWPAPVPMYTLAIKATKRSCTLYCHSLYTVVGEATLMWGAKRSLHKWNSPHTLCFTLLVSISPVFMSSSCTPHFSHVDCQLFWSMFISHALISFTKSLLSYLFSCWYCSAASQNFSSPIVPSPWTGHHEHSWFSIKFAREKKLTGSNRARFSSLAYKRHLLDIYARKEARKQNWKLENLSVLIQDSSEQTVDSYIKSYTYFQRQTDTLGSASTYLNTWHFFILRDLWLPNRREL